MPPIQYGSNFKLPRKNYHKTCWAPPPTSAWLKLFLPPLFVGVKLQVPPLPFCSPLPLPVISDQSLIRPQMMLNCCFQNIMVSSFEFSYLINGHADTTAQKYTFKELNNLEREPLRYWKGDEKVTLTIPVMNK